MLPACVTECEDQDDSIAAAITTLDCDQLHAAEKSKCLKEKCDESTLTEMMAKVEQFCPGASASLGQDVKDDELVKDDVLNKTEAHKHETPECIQRCEDEDGLIKHAWKTKDCQEIYVAENSRCLREHCDQITLTKTFTKIHRNCKKDDSTATLGKLATLDSLDREDTVRDDSVLQFEIPACMTMCEDAHAKRGALAFVDVLSDMKAGIVQCGSLMHIMENNGCVESVCSHQDKVAMIVKVREVCSNRPTAEIAREVRDEAEIEVTAKEMPRIR